MVQRAISKAGLVLDPDSIAVLNKGQRSVKGLSSGFEKVATRDLIVTLAPAEQEPPKSVSPTIDELDALIDQLLRGSDIDNPSRLYLELIREGMRRHWDLAELDLGYVTDALVHRGVEIDQRTGRFKTPVG